MIRTPISISDEITSFCHGIIAGVRPKYVRVQPVKFAMPNECFTNVPERIALRGGSQLNGWAVRIWPGVFMEAEHHCVWQKPDGNLLDITPKILATKKILFLPDPAREYDYEHEQRLDNIRSSLTDDADVTEFLELATSLHNLIEKSSEGRGRISMPDSNEHSRLRGRAIKAEYKLMKKYLGPKDPCWCQSGKPLGKCHKTLHELEKNLLNT